MRVIEFPKWRDAHRRISALSFGPKSDTLAAVCWADHGWVEVAWYDLRKGEVTESTFGAALGEDAYPPAPAFSPDHRFLACMANFRGGVEYLLIYDREAKSKAKRVRPLTAWPYAEEYGDPHGRNYQSVKALAFTPDGGHVLAAIAGGHPEDDDAHAADLGIYRWNVAKILAGRGKKSAGHFLPDPDFFLPFEMPDVFSWGRYGNPLVVSPDGTQVACGMWDKRVRLWNLPSGEEVPEPKRKKRRLPMSWRLAYSPDGGTLACGDDDVTLLDTATGQPRATFAPKPTRGHNSQVPFVVDLAFHPTESLLATAHHDATARWWDGATGKPRGSFKLEVGPLNAVAFSPDDCLCAAAGDKGRVAVWDVGG